MTFHNKLLAKNCFSTCQSPNGLCTYASWRAPLWESEGSVTPFLEAVVVVLRAALFAGVLRDATWLMSQYVQPFPMPFWAKPIIHVGLLFITTIPSCVRVPTETQLCSAGCAGGFSGTAFHARFTTLMVSRGRGACASSWHRGERNRTSTASKKTLWARPRPWLRGHFEGTDRSDSLNVGYKEQISNRMCYGATSGHNPRACDAVGERAGYA
jgi:hypothetical protein